MAAAGRLQAWGYGGHLWLGRVTRPSPFCEEKKKGKEVKGDPGQQPQADTPSGRRGDGRPASPILEA